MLVGRLNFNASRLSISESYTQASTTIRRTPLRRLSRTWMRRPRRLGLIIISPSSDRRSGGSHRIIALGTLAPRSSSKGTDQTETMVRSFAELSARHQFSDESCLVELK